MGGSSLGEMLAVVADIVQAARTPPLAPPHKGEGNLAGFIRAFLGRYVNAIERSADPEPVRPTRSEERTGSGFGFAAPE